MKVFSTTVLTQDESYKVGVRRQAKVHKKAGKGKGKRKRLCVLQ